MTIAKITLAGVEYEIPRLKIRQLMIVEPATMRLSGISFGTFSEENYEDIARIVHAGLTVTNPKLTFEQFKDWDATRDELFLAARTVVDQSRALKESPPGEAEAGGQPTGDASPSVAAQ